MYQLAAALIATVALAAGGKEPYFWTTQGADWGQITGYETCGTGREQSPINLSETNAKTGTGVGIMTKDYDDITIPEDDADLKIEVGNFYVPYADGGFTLQYNETEKKDWDAAQFHFHAPSEHTIDRNQYDLKMHLVHMERGTGALGAVIGVFFDTSAGDEENVFIQGLIEGAERDVLVEALYDTVDFTKYWNYEGSLTTPPCTEGVKWTVIQQVQPISKAQLKVFTDLWADDKPWTQDNGKLGNFREVQDLNDRTLWFFDGSVEAGSKLPPDEKPDGDNKKDKDAADKTKDEDAEGAYSGMSVAAMSLSAMIAFQLN